MASARSQKLRPMQMMVMTVGSGRLKRSEAFRPTAQTTSSSPASSRQIQWYITGSGSRGWLPPWGGRSGVEAHAQQRLQNRHEHFRPLRQPFEGVLVHIGALRQLQLHGL